MSKQPPHLTKQICTAPVGYVAGRDINISVPNAGQGPSLGPQKWVSKHYLFGTSVSAGWLAVIAYATLFVSVYLMTTGPFFVGYAVLLTAALSFYVTGNVSKRGFLAIPHTLRGFAKDYPNRNIFLGKVGGTGTVCPICTAELKFQNVENGSFLRCTRSSAHSWPFDFTAVQD
jgi:hypothetical protein